MLVHRLLLRSRGDLRRSEYETRERCVEQVTALHHEFLQVRTFFYNTSHHTLRAQEFLQEFEKQDPSPMVERMKRAKAAAWYRVAYDPRMTCLPATPAPLSSPGRGPQVMLPRQLYSFGWIPFDILMEVKTERMAAKAQAQRAPAAPAAARRSSARNSLAQALASIEVT